MVMENNMDLIEQTIERLESEGIDNLNNWFTDCNLKKEVFLQLAYDAKMIFDQENIEWKNEFSYRYKKSMP